jgi:hypothetical protein
MHIIRKLHRQFMHFMKIHEKFIHFTTACCKISVQFLPLGKNILVIERNCQKLKNKLEKELVWKICKRVSNFFTLAYSQKALRLQHKNTSRNKNFGRQTILPMFTLNLFKSCKQYQIKTDLMFLWFVGIPWFICKVV